MTDLQRLIEWHEAQADTILRHATDMLGDIGQELANRHAETARILSLLLRVRDVGEITIKKSPQFKHRIEIHASWDTLRDLAELLGGGK